MTLPEVLLAVETGARPECTDAVAFLDLVIDIAARPEFIRQYDRLRGTSLGKMASQSPIVTMIDRTTGYFDAQLSQFAVDVYDLFWLRLPPECIYDYACRRNR